MSTTVNAQTWDMASHVMRQESLFRRLARVVFDLRDAERRDWVGLKAVNTSGSLATIRPLQQVFLGQRRGQTSPLPAPGVEIQGCGSTGGDLNPQ